jgi:hypothetical protein
MMPSEFPASTNSLGLHGAFFVPNEARPDRADGTATLPTEVPPPGTIWLTLFRVMSIATTKGYGAASPRASGNRRLGR